MRKLRPIMATLVLLLLFGSTFVAANGQTSNSEKAIEHVSKKQDLPKEQLMIVNEGQANYPLTEMKIWRAKILDKKSGSVYGVDIDEAGNIIDNIREIGAKEKDAYVKKYGKLEPELHKHLQNMTLNETIKVEIWLTSSEIDKPKPEGKMSEKEYNDRVAEKKKTYALKQKPVVDFLRAKGFNIIYTSRYAPSIFAELPKSVITELENRADVDIIYISRVYEPELNSVAYTEKANVVWNRGITGSGITLAVVEDDGIEFANPYLADGSYYDSINKNIGYHATAIAGIIESTHSTYKGIAYGAPALLSANSQDYSDASIVAATEWALDNGANIISNSWGVDTNLQIAARDRYLDHLVWDHYKTVVKSAGNRGTLDGDVTSPGLGYNMITVGAIDDKDTSSWSDDVLASYSSYKDPISPNNDREKPEVVAVGTSVYSTTTSSPWVGCVTGCSGTSYAAPSVAAEAALLMQRAPWLETWPETVKAVIMASAVHNIEGGSRLSEYDGAGAIDASKADDTASNGRMAGNVLNAADFPKSYTFSASAGQKVRVVVNWDSHPDSNHPPSTDPLESDLDLYIYDPSGNFVTSSTSWDNSYEIVEFTASATGTYEARVSAYRFDGSYEYVGFAYTFA